MAARLGYGKSATCLTVILSFGLLVRVRFLQESNFYQVETESHGALKATETLEAQTFTTV